VLYRLSEVVLSLKLLTMLLLWVTKLEKKAFFVVVTADDSRCYVVLLWLVNVGMGWVSCIRILQKCKRILLYIQPYVEVAKESNIILTFEQ
jgi:hypothetical protein